MSNGAGKEQGGSRGGGKRCRRADPVYEIIKVIVADVFQGFVVVGFNAVVEVACPYKHLSIPHALPLHTHTHRHTVEL